MTLLKQTILYARSIALLSVAAISGIVGIVGLFTRPITAQSIGVVNPFEYEHRVTSLEVSVKAIADSQASLVAQLNDLRTTKWLELVALSGLLGETGIRTFRAVLGSKEE
jgi:hypothetical protein